MLISRFSNEKGEPVGFPMKKEECQPFNLMAITLNVPQ
jgi:hypothetical protein